MAHPPTLGPYELGEQIATGGMAEIFHATKRGAAGFERDVCIKRIQKQFSDDPAFRRMFENEALISGRIQHPNVVQVHDYDHDDDTYYIAMEFVFGRDLRAVQTHAAAQGERIPWALAARICHDTARGLGAAHRLLDRKKRPLPVIHRDVSPHNILLSFAGEVKIADFGISKLKDSDPNTSFGVIKGKPGYMSPEATLGAVLDARTDVFSLGIVLWELLTGDRLFDADSSVAIKQVQHGEIPKPSSRRFIPERLEAVAMKALEHERKERYADAGEMADALKDFLLNATYTTREESVEQFMATLYPDESRPAARVRTEVFTPDEPAAPATPVPNPDAAGPLEPTGTITATVSRRGLAIAAAAATIAVIAAALAAGIHFAKAPPPSASAPSTAAPSSPKTRPAVCAPTAGAESCADPSPAPAKEHPAPAALQMGDIPEKAPAARSGRTDGVTQAKTASPDGATTQPSGTLPSAAAPPKPAARTGRLTLNANPWADIYLKGKKIGTTPLINHPLPEGTHKIVLKNPELNAQKELTVRIAADKLTTVPVDLLVR